MGPVGGPSLPSRTNLAFCFNLLPRLVGAWISESESDSRKIAESDWVSRQLEDQLPRQGVSHSPIASRAIFFFIAFIVSRTYICSREDILGGCRDSQQSYGFV